MALSVSLGPASLVQLGISISDIAFFYSVGRKFGNWFRAKRNDEELFESIMEDPEALMKRRGLVDTTKMENLWWRTDFIYEGRQVDNEKQQKQECTNQDLSSFSWLMVAVVTALDLCLPLNRLQSLIIDVFVKVLDNDDAAAALQVQIAVNIESWKSVGRVRGLARVMGKAVMKCRGSIVEEQSIPQLNIAETEEMKAFLIWLMKDNGNEFKVMSATTFAVADGLRKVGVHLSTESTRNHEAEPLVFYVPEQATGASQLSIHHLAEYDDPLNLSRGLGSRAQQISYPRQHPAAMIDSIQAERDVINLMKEFWFRGAKAGASMKLQPTQSKLPFSSIHSEIFYELDVVGRVSSSFGPEVGMLASNTLPRSQEILLAVEALIKNVSKHQVEWLQMHTALEFLFKNESSLPSRRGSNMALWLQYQALVFGFYYKLLEPLISLELVGSDSYFRGLWGYGSTTFLAMCTQFSDALRSENGVSRTHVLYMIATMYNGRQKIWNPSRSSIGLLGITGTISVFTMPLIRTTDAPEEIARFAILDLPVVDLIANADGELYAGNLSGIRFDHQAVNVIEIHPHGPGKSWSVHAKMGIIYGDGQPGVVMAARCDGRLVGWFSPLAADVLFLSSAYQAERHREDGETVGCSVVSGFQILDEDWQAGCVQRVIDENPNNTIGIVHSRGCPALRYAATGFYAGAGDEVAIATDDIDVAVGRVDGQGGGIIIT